MRSCFALVVAVAFLVGCKGETAVDVEAKNAPDNGAANATLPFVSPQAIEAAQATILKEPGVIDMVHQPDEVFQWLVGMNNDGSYRYGYAESLCIVLREQGVTLPRQAVRIVDYQRYIRDGDSHAASMGAVDCDTGQHVFP